MNHGSICYIEFSTTDLEKSKAFYESLFGWKVDPEPGSSYAIFSTPEGIHGGFIGAAEGPATTGPIVYIEVDDIDGMLGKINGAGGDTLSPKTKISDEHGYCALAADNVGNRIGLWSRT